MSGPDNFLELLDEYPVVRAHRHHDSATLRLARAMADAVGTVRRQAVAAAPLRVELTADLLVVVEAAVVAAAAAASPAASPALRALTAWRVHRDATAILGGVLAIAAPEDRDSTEALRSELHRTTADTVGLALQAQRELLDLPGLAQVLAEIEATHPTEVPDYLEPAAQAVRDLVPVLSRVADEDYRLDDEGVEAGLAYLFDPLSATHTGALLTAHAADRLVVGDARAATIARRWCYARVRATTLEGLSPRHVGKSRRLVQLQPVTG
ncbi:hypothetical protein [Micromonospora sp. NPDC047134]|uniref:hypothetical protein n=1 Tax=Micromonospora sp. NPDC047134 TaxID=3154340 RepID=UPI0033D1EF9E